MLRVILTLAVLIAAGCGTTASTLPPAETSLADKSGADVYREHCASCHDTGAEGAPVVGRASDWSDRSKLWQGILMDHARTGYLNMPPKGGNPELSDASVNAAVEFMLERTHKDLPADQ